MHSAFITASGVAPRNGIFAKQTIYIYCISVALSLQTWPMLFFSYIFPCDIAGVLIFFGLTMVSQSFLTFRLDVIRLISPNREAVIFHCLSLYMYHTLFSDWPLICLSMYFASLVVHYNKSNILSK
jgi:hypothetical protein